MSVRYYCAGFPYLLICKQKHESNSPFLNFLLIVSVTYPLRRHLLQYQEPMPAEQLVTYICDIKHAYTMYGGRRPFGVSMLFIAWDRIHGYQLYQSDPSGNFMGWKAMCIGSNASAANSMLEQEHKAGMSLEEGLSLAVKVLNKTMTMSKLTADKVRAIED